MKSVVFQLFDTISISLKKKTEQICALESSDGNCEAFYPKFFFNSKVGRCELFLYGGCGGNDNRFNSMRECESKCGNFKLKKSNWMPINALRYTTMSTNLRFDFFVLLFRYYSVRVNWFISISKWYMTNYHIQIYNFLLMLSP